MLMSSRHRRLTSLALVCFTFTTQQQYCPQALLLTASGSWKVSSTRSYNTFATNPRVLPTHRSSNYLSSSSLLHTRKMSSFDLNTITESLPATGSTDSASSSSSSPYPYPNQGYVDVHAHLLHEKFEGKEHDIVQQCIAAGLDHVIINGLEPESNRAILSFCETHYPIHMLPAMGIYPLDAACNMIFTQEDIDRMKQEREAKSGSTEGDKAEEQEPLPEVNWKHDFPPPTKFNVDNEIDFIEQMVIEKRIVALGECGLDKHYLTDDISFNEQIRVLRKLMKIAAKYDIPIILHTRKAEKKVFDMLIEENVKKADFHCFCGKLKLGLDIAEAGYYLSIPSAVANSDQNSSFKKLAAAMRLDRLLTETDSPYMGPVKGEHNTPATVPQAIETIAKLRNIDPAEMKNIVRQNFRDLFNL